MVALRLLHAGHMACSWTARSIGDANGDQLVVPKYSVPPALHDCGRLVSGLDYFAVIESECHL